MGWAVLEKPEGHQPGEPSALAHQQAALMPLCLPALLLPSFLL